MAKIQIMPDDLASQVAAGEVVERPASVVKELLENSLDAGARRIEVLAERGGASLLRVIDDGAGMSRQDALLSVERHATSKLRSKEDLARISTYGFRGEALPSIASVSRLRLATREREAIAGTEILIEGGVTKEVRDCGEPPGTQVEVRSLFFNVPARRKFLRAEATEFTHIEAAVRLAALARPEVAFTLRHGARLVFQVGASRGRLERIADLAGAEVAENLIELELSAAGSGLEIDGWVARPGFTRPNRAMQYLFLNGRPIDCSAVNFALREAYAGLLERGRHPPVFLFVSADPGLVDVNVHPAKREVRFHDARGLQALVSRAVHAALLTRTVSIAPPTAPTSGAQAASAPAVTATAEVPEIRSQPSLPVRAVAPAPEEPRPAGGVAKAPAGDAAAGGGQRPALDVRILGKLGERYVILESEEGLVLLHRRAAHERVLFEAALAAIEQGGVDSQALLSPAVLQLGPQDYQVARSHCEALERLGIGLEPFGANTLKIDRLPAFCGDVDPVRFVAAVIAEIREEGLPAGRRVADRELAASVSHRAARVREATHLDEIEGLIASLLRCEMPYCDPRGRPTMIQISHQELARKFGIG